MKRPTVLLGSELGAGLGHAEKLLVIARGLAARGWRPLLAVREPAEVHPLLAGTFPVLQAPFLRVRRPRPDELPRSMAGVFAAFGFDDQEIVASAVACWRTLLDEVQPALVVADYSPMLCLAAKGLAPVVVVGSGFCLPPPQQERFATLAADQPAPDRDERSMVEAIAAAQERAKGWIPPALPALFAGSAHFVLAIPEMDPYAPWRAAPAAGPLQVPVEPVPCDGSLDLFAYLAAEDPLTPIVLAGLARTSYRAAVFVRDRRRWSEPLPSGDHLQLLDQPLPFELAMRRARVVLHHGGLGMAQKALFLGRQQVVVPRHFEQKLNADGILRLGAGLAIGRRARADRVAEVVSALLDGPPQPFHRAEELGAELRRRFPEGALAPVVEACDRLGRTAPRLLVDPAIPDCLTT
jgi:rhamnosyltransferase subunit B